MRETCGRELHNRAGQYLGTCAELEGHKSACMTAGELAEYNEQMAALDPRNRRRAREQQDRG
jgi:heme/copper-type cytochrome/quinol oxidase subunit 2